MMKIAVIGAGMAGLTLARALNNRAEVTLFDKSRGVGGRLSTRRADPFAFDHGAQFFTARSKVFQAVVADLVARGAAARWDARVVDFDGSRRGATQSWDANNAHYVGVPGMNAIGKALAEGLNLQRQTRIETLEAANGGWRLHDDQGRDRGRFDWVVCAAPAEQTAALMPTTFAHHAVIRERRMQPCFALMLGFEQPLLLDFEVARFKNAAISWMAVNSSKPGRNQATSLLVHAAHDWSALHLEDDNHAVITTLTQATGDLLGQDLSHAKHRAVHRWRYAIIDQQDGPPFFLDAERRLAACGDWCIGGRVEAAFQSGHELAKAITQRL
ncbi:NAD(P)/FAD-dependent oxidoreductase [Acanthopleuribacter pedis]|uniref:FAD-dependent oxidoreductase n=1 Tax=Acanthopleuribacter pedis TaxID=442870 RepID=A0A8J7Q460_9BACT|nr:FAD-dependent oxidoreductase [Acanthopleuribacter pedis]MBO1317727.1 FAD-dependent oxidoreductase [Acanthopleuribacter pedis]